jgi:hypothetical protein
MRQKDAQCLEKKKDMSKLKGIEDRIRPGKRGQWITIMYAIIRKLNFFLDEIVVTGRF